MYLPRTGLKKVCEQAGTVFSRKSSARSRFILKKGICPGQVILSVRYRPKVGSFLRNVCGQGRVIFQKDICPRRDHFRKVPAQGRSERYLLREGIFLRNLSAYGKIIFQKGICPVRYHSAWAGPY